MNSYQRLWWHQASTDHDCFEFFRERGFRQCHCLHYLQMATEKLAKAYLWREGPPPFSHAGFRPFVRSLVDRHRSVRNRERIAQIFSFTRFGDLQRCIYAAMPIVHELERLAPTLAANGPNPEYPWPHATPQFAPVHFDFPAWHLLQSNRGRELLRVLRIALQRFAEYADT